MNLRIVNGHALHLGKDQGALCECSFPDRSPAFAKQVPLVGLTFLIAQVFSQEE